MSSALVVKLLKLRSVFDVLRQVDAVWHGKFPEVTLLNGTETVFLVATVS